MECVYLGFFSWLFNKIWDAILKPVIEFFGGLLESVLSVLFDKVLMPLLINVLFPLIKSVATMVLDIVADVLFEVYVTVLSLIDTMTEVFNIFAGITTVQYKGNDTYLLYAIFSMTPVMRMCWLIVALSISLLLVFSIVSVIRSIGELGNEVQRPVSKVLRSTFDGFLKMFSAPFTCLLLIIFMQTLLVSIHSGIEHSNDIEAQGKGTTTTLGRTIFVVSSLDAASDTRYNISTADDAMMSVIGINDTVRAPYYYTDYKENGRLAAKDYTDVDEVRKYFKPNEIDYLIGIAMALLFAFTLARGTFTFIARLFNIILLTILAPIFGSTIPLDDGERYERWRDMYVGQLFSGFGLVIAMQIYMMLVPVIMDGRIQFGKGTLEANYLIRILFLGAGAYMVQQVGPVITGIVSQAAASNEMANNAMFGAGILMALGGVGGLFFGSSNSKKVEKLEEKKSGEKDDNQKAADKKSKDNKDNKDKEKEKEKSKMDQEIEKRKKKAEEANKDAKKDKKEEGDDKDKPKAGVQKSYLGGLFVKGVGKDGKEHWGFNLGSKFNFGLKEDGSVSGNVFGIGWKKGKDGNVDKVSVPFMRFKRGDDGNMHCSKVKISEGLQFRRTEEVTRDEDGNVTSRKLGDMYCSDISAIGMKRRYDNETGEVETQSMLGTHYERSVGDDGAVSYKKSYTKLGGLYSRTYGDDDDDGDEEE